ncbi:MAG TPA: alpha/beta fold hydrolase [Pseudonocardiaceae bacterium]
MPVLPGAEPFAYDGSTDIGVLICHGFTGSPRSMRPWAEHAREAGFSVRLPLLPGHGTAWQDLNRTGWRDWYATVEQALLELSARCRSVFVFGLSMGGTLSLRLAECHNPEIAGLVLVNPSVTTLRRDAALLPLLSRLLPSVAAIGNDIKKPDTTEGSYDRTPLRAAASLRELWGIVRADLSKIETPLLLLRSAEDHVVEPVNAKLILDNISSTDVREVVLPNSFHVATLDNDAATIFTESVDFARRIHTQRTTQQAG